MAAPDARVYHEEQRFRQWWVVVLVLGPAALGWWLFVRQILLGSVIGDNPAPNWVLWLLWALIGVALPLAFFYIRLVLEVTPDQVVIRFRPLSKRAIPLAEIALVKVRTYNAVKEYGGWGIKGWSSNNMAYNVSGNRGVELTLSGGRRVLLGSQRPEELAEAIEAQLEKQRRSQGRRGR